MNKKLLLLLAPLLSLAAIIIFGLLYFYSKQQTNLSINFLDVGQGDAIFIKTPFNQNILVDGGPDSTVIKRLGENLPWWSRTIDLLVLTHPHDDHIIGLNEIIKRYDVRKIIYTGVVYDSSAYDSWQESVKAYQIPTVIIDHPQIINLGKNCNLEILYPRQAIYGQSIDNLNNSSLVSKLVCAGVKILLAGDAEQAEEKELLQVEADLSADIIKVGHHGSDTASSEEFLAKVKPQYAIIEVGKNDFGLPSLRVIKRLERRGVKIYRTDQSGTIVIKKNDQKIEILPER